MKTVGWCILFACKWVIYCVMVDGVRCSFSVVCLYVCFVCVLEWFVCALLCAVVLFVCLCMFYVCVSVCVMLCVNVF